MNIFFLAATADSDDDADSVVSGADDNFGQDGDSIFVRNLPNGVRFHEVFDLFAKVGQIKVRSKTIRRLSFIYLTIFSFHFSTIHDRKNLAYISFEI